VFTLSPSVKKDMFGSIKAIADALSAATNSSAEKAIFHNRMGEGLASLDQLLTNINNTRGAIGARMNNVDTLKEINQDFRLQLETVRSDTQDLDYAEAISRFNLQLTSLQAAQQAFVKTAGLSLFQYI
jgi:flagellar hook-associated protein 3 FlgL